MKARKFFFKKPSKKNRHMDDGKYIVKLKSLYLDQISASSKFVRYVLQDCLFETSFGK